MSEQHVKNDGQMYCTIILCKLLHFECCCCCCCCFYCYFSVAATAVVFAVAAASTSVTIIAAVIALIVVVTDGDCGIVALLLLYSTVGVLTQPN